MHRHDVAVLAGGPSEARSARTPQVTTPLAYQAAAIYPSFERTAKRAVRAETQNQPAHDQCHPKTVVSIHRGPVRRPAMWANIGELALYPDEVPGPVIIANADHASPAAGVIKLIAVAAEANCIRDHHALANDFCIAVA